MCTVSVIIPTFNRASTILSSVNSVLLQSFKDFEILVIDDGSTDNTEQIIKSIKDSRVKYLYQKNQGACAARNLGIKNAKGKYIAFQDSDDYWFPNKLEHQIHVLDEQNCDICFCRMYIDSKCIFPVRSINNSNLTYKLLLQQNFISTQTILAKREVFNHDLFDISMPRFQDWDLALRLFPKYNFYLLDEVLVQQNQQNDSISKNNVKLIKAIQLIEHKYLNIWLSNLKEYSSLIRQLGKAYVKIDRKAALKYFKKANRISFSVKNIVYYFLTLLGINHD